MPCYSPWVAKGERAMARPLSCGKCIGCKLEYSRQWAVRCMHEAQLYDQNCFITLTYNRPFYTLVYRDFQLFMKRLRARFNRARIRFYMCGEYQMNGRPHFHACLFNFDFPDKVYLKSLPSGFKLYRSPILEELWTEGFSSVGSVTFESAAYCARYVTKKLSGDGDEHVYSIIDPDTGEIFRRVKEFGRMSLKPGIGFEWYRKFRKDVYPHDMVVVRGSEARPPRYYDRMFKAQFPDQYREMLAKRAADSMAKFDDNLPHRLVSKEKVTYARLGLLKRGLD